MHDYQAGDLAVALLNAHGSSCRWGSAPGEGHNDIPFLDADLPDVDLVVGRLLTIR